MMRFYVEGVGLCGPGLDGWAASLAVLAGARPYAPAPTLPPPCTRLPPNERRRAPLMVKLGCAVAAEAFAAAGRDPAQTAVVFTSSGGDGDTIHEILTVLAAPNPELSPTRFHNSVHNASSGYWSIASRSHAASSSLCCHDDSFAAGLLEAAVQATVSGTAVALVAYDVQYPFPLSDVRPIGAAFAVALVLCPERTPASRASVSLELRPGAAMPSAAVPGLEALRQTTPAARGLPLLTALAGEAETKLTFSYLDDMALCLAVTPLRDVALPETGEPARRAA